MSLRMPVIRGYRKLGGEGIWCNRDIPINRLRCSSTEKLEKIFKQEQTGLRLNLLRLFVLTQVCDYQGGLALILSLSIHLSIHSLIHSISHSFIYLVLIYNLILCFIFQGESSVDKAYKTFVDRLNESLKVCLDLVVFNSHTLIVPEQNCVLIVCVSQTFSLKLVVFTVKENNFL